MSNLTLHHQFNIVNTSPVHHQKSTPYSYICMWLQHLRVMVNVLDASFRVWGRIQFSVIATRSVAGCWSIMKIVKTASSFFFHSVWPTAGNERVEVQTYISPFCSPTARVLYIPHKCSFIHRRKNNDGTHCSRHALSPKMHRWHIIKIH